MELADVLAAAISESRTLINQTGKRWPDRPIRLELNWHPQMQKVDLVLSAVDHLPPFKPARPSAASEGEALSA